MIRPPGVTTCLILSQGLLKPLASIMFHDQQVTQINYLLGKERLSFICWKVVTFSFQGLASYIPRKDKKMAAGGGRERETGRKGRKAERKRERRGGD